MKSNKWISLHIVLAGLVGAIISYSSKYFFSLNNAIELVIFLVVFIGIYSGSRRWFYKKARLLEENSINETE